MIMVMVSLNLADTVVTFLALLGPQKVLLAFARIARTLNTRQLRVVAAATAVTATCVGAACALTAPWLATFFHVSTAGLELAAGLVFFIYAVGLVLGIHFDPTDMAHDAVASRAVASPAEAAAPGVEPDPLHPLTSGFRAMLLPFVVSPLAVAAALTDSLSADDWSSRWTVAAAFAVVAFIDAVCMVIFGPLLGRAHETVLEVLSRLLGILLAAVGVQLFLDGLGMLGALPGGTH
jgi:multiple antibiotic resistance protein